MQKYLRWQICNSYETRKVVTYMTGKREREREREKGRGRVKEREKERGEYKEYQIYLNQFHKRKLK